ncbi:MAG: copper resistance protein CopC [Defluviicoccus sp.]|nr:copper resistance protein CopC [Defluviicoccus sp.]MDE0383455.1 copper resistance protein CopC [Defluviicoccus sp.]
MRRTLIAGCLVLLAAAALAHSRLGTTVPADGAVLAAMPAEIVLTFTKRLRLTRVRMTREGKSVDLDLGGAKGFATRFTIPLQGPGPGSYRIEWRGLAADGHAMRGAFSFRVE